MTYESDADRAVQAEVSAIMARAFRCEVITCPSKSPVDFHLLRRGRVVAVAELKGRKNPASAYPTVFLSVKKYEALRRRSDYFKCQALFVARFADRSLYVLLDAIDATRVRYFNTRKVYRCPSDREHVIEVPVDVMQELTA